MGPSEIKSGIHLAIKDVKAIEIVKKIDYIFLKFDKILFECSLIGLL